MDEDNHAMISMGSFKGFGTGFHALFYQKYLEVVGLKGGDISLYKNNHTLIVLIPKQKSLAWMKEFKPISIYNELGNIVSKMVANQL